MDSTIRPVDELLPVASCFSWSTHIQIDKADRIHVTEWVCCCLPFLCSVKEAEPTYYIYPLGSRSRMWPQKNRSLGSILGSIHLSISNPVFVK